MIKKGVRLHGVLPQMFLAHDIYVELCDQYGFPHCITSGIEGRHKRSSEHWGGRALDFRTWVDDSGEQWDDLTRTQFCAKLRGALSEEYVVIGEPDHIHCHYSPLKAT